MFWNLAPIILSESVAKNPETTTTIKWYFVEIIDRWIIIKAINIDPKILANVPSTLIPPSVPLSTFLSEVIKYVSFPNLFPISLPKVSANFAEKRGGRRGPENVWGSAATGLFLAIMTKFNAANVVLFKVGFAASFAAKLADTFGSEIGKRFGKDTYLITSLKKVDRGTEGGISIEGTLASVLGSIFMAFIMLLLSIISTKYHFIVVVVSGFLATLSESIIGAKFQNKYKLSNELVNAIQTSIASVFAIFALILYSYF